MVGDGHIDFGAFTRSVALAGHHGDVEIFNADVWATPGDAVVVTLSQRYLDQVEPWLR